MPLYEYRCLKGGHLVEIHRAFADSSPPTCPVCGTTDLQRVFSPVSLVKSERDRSTDVSWIDRDVATRLRKKAGGKLSPAFRETLDRMESS